MMLIGSMEKKKSYSPENYTNEYQLAISLRKIRKFLSVMLFEILASRVLYKTSIEGVRTS